MRTVLCALALLAITSVCRAEVIYVDVDATGAGDGTSWSDAWTDLQDALRTAMPGDEIWVAEGEYRPGDGTDRSATFRLIDGVGLYGGFAGDETARAERDWLAHDSVLSGRIGEPDPIPYEDPGDDVHHVVTAEFLGPETVLDGFTIRNGHSPYYATLSEGGGGGILIRDSDLVVRHSVIRNCLADGHGGAVWIAGDSTPEFVDVEFRFNGTIGGSGGAVCAGHPAPPSVTFRDCVFADNFGMYGAFSCPSEVYDCRFERNSTMYWSVISGPLRVERTLFVENANNNGASGSIFSGIVHMQDCRFERNSTNTSADDTFHHYLASSAIWGGGTLVNVSFVDNVGGYGSVVSTSGTTMVNCLVVSGSVHVGAHPEEAPFEPAQNPFTMVNCTVASGSVVSNGEPVEIANTIVWDPSPGAPARPAIAALNGAELSVSHSAVQGSGGSGSAWDPAFGIDLGGNIAVDPMFVSPGAGDFHLAPGSPCIDSGDTHAVPEGITTDLAGNPRFMRSAVDIGCYEADGPLSLDDPRVPEASLPGRYLYAAPNPFNPSTTIYYGVTEAGHVELIVYELAGRRVKTLVSGHVEAGRGEVQWDGRDEQGRRVASGVYLYRLVAGEFRETKRMVLLK